MTRPFSEESANFHKLIGDPNHAELFRYLDTVGNGSGSKSMNTTPDEYIIKPPDGYIYLIDKIHIAGWDDAIASGATFFGISALSTGCKLELRSGPNENVLLDLTNGELIKNNGDLACIGDTQIINDHTATICLVYCNINPGAPIRLDGSKEDMLVFESQVTLAGISGLRIMVVGRAYTNNI